MHVGYVLKKFPRNSETFILNEILALQRHGADVTVFSLNRPDDGVFHRALADLKRPVVYLPTRKSDATLQWLRRHADLLAARGPELLTEFLDLLRAGRPDLWQVLGWGLDVATLARQHGVQRLHAHFATVAAQVARCAKALGGLPFSVTCHAKDIYREGVRADNFTALLGPADFAVTVCEANRDHIHRHLGGDRLDVRTLYNGVDTQAFHPGRRQEDPTPMVLSVGRLVEKKGFHVLLRALQRLQQDGLRPRCVLVGDGEDKESLLRLRQELQLDHVEFAGMRTQDEVRELMQRATLLALPCIIGQDGNRDALPTVLLEAMAAGLPVISTPVGGVEEIVDHGRAGGLVPAGDDRALAAAIAGLLRDPARRSAWSQAGRARAEQLFDLQTNTARLLGWYRAGARQEALR